MFAARHSSPARAAPARVRTPVRSASATKTVSANNGIVNSRSGSTAAKAVTSATPRSMTPQGTPRGVIASSPTARRASPTVRNVPPSSAVTPGSRQITPLKIQPLPSSGVRQEVTPRSGSRAAGIVTTPRVAGIRAESPIRSKGQVGGHTRETSALQKAQLKKENEEMNARVNQLMAIKKPTHIENYFRVDFSRDDDLRMTHLERIMVDPERNMGSIRVGGNSAALVTHMAGIIGSSPSVTPRNRPDLGDIQPRGKAQFPAASKSSNTISGTKKEIEDQKALIALRESESARRIRSSSASENAPWNKGPSHASPATQRSHSAQRSTSRNPSPLTFDPSAPIDKVPARPHSPLHRHHDVYTDAPGVDKRGISPLHHVTSRTRTEDAIRKQMAAEPPLELPPRKKPAIKPGITRPAHDIFNTPYGDEAVCKSAKTTMGKKILDSLAKPSTSNPNQMNDRSYDASPAKGKRHGIEGLTTSGAAGVIAAQSNELADASRRRSNPDRNQSTLGFVNNGLQSGRAQLVMSPVRRPAPASARISSTSVNAPFGNETTEVATVTKNGVSSPQRYSSPVDKARGCRSPGFYSKPSSAMQRVFNWEN